MAKPPDSPTGPLKPLFFMGLALLLTPGIVTFASLCLLPQVELTLVFTRFPGLVTSPEMIVAALLAVVIGMAICLVIAVLSSKRPTLADMMAIELSQAFAFFLAIAALLHNPQEEFCKAGPVGSALAKAFQLESCSLTTDFWMQAGVGGLVAAAFFVLVLRLFRAAAQAISS
jgi:Zn-dependent protease with chaperone function